jgi:hypothetical protein
MSERFDRLSRTMASDIPRRRLLKMAGVAFAGATAATVLRPFKAKAACCTVPCGSTCCDPSQVCVDPNRSLCGCASGAGKCGGLCCDAGETCSDPNLSCCCPGGTTPCGTNCCNSGVACVDRSRGICGCPSGTTRCGSASNLTCCPAGQSCGSSGCTKPSGTSTPAVCQRSASDIALKENVVAVRWAQ